MKFEPNGGPDWIAVLEELKGEDAEQAAEDLALSYEDWCDPLDG
ncbi:hypothetical protein [Nocardioides aromaticivorans]|nr:hypothetical protein [Nocardioides aromaticivorans]